MKSTTVSVFLNQEDCHCSIFELYKRAALASDYDVTENTRFDCEKTHCSEEVLKEVRKYYQEKGLTYFQFAALWVGYGPKADIIDKKHSPWVVSLEDGAFYEEKK